MFETLGKACAQLMGLLVVVWAFIWLMERYHLQPMYKRGQCPWAQPFDVCVENVRKARETTGDT